MQKYFGTIKIRFWYSEAFEGTSQIAGLSLSLTHQEKYQFINAAHWIYADYGRAVEIGAREGLWEAGFDPDLGIQIRLDEVEEHRVSSSERAFYVAAKCAARSRVTILTK